MSVASGTRLGPYEIMCALGAGGMGEVYKARDTRLDREVAIKVVASGLTASPEARSRFEREARAISRLKHPHVCPLYDVGHEQDVDYIVMELLEGETLAERLRKGPLPVSEALTTGVQIADALDAAHRLGIVHRDLKPGNVMLTATGARLMDFGLARASTGAAAGQAASESPTFSSPLTSAGTIVGTIQYMAPEQLEGKEADGRADLWALGCVLHEMVTGRQAFEGKSHASLIAAIIDREPAPVSALQPMSPPSLDHLVRRCLAKDPAERWQTARDLLHELRWIAEAGSQTLTQSGVALGRSVSQRLAWLVLVALGVVIALLAFVLATNRSPAPGPGVVRFSIAAPGTGTILADSSAGVISPDGRQLVFTVVDSEGAPRLWLRKLDSLTP
jgi:serine/threonine protein kinase